MITVKSGDPADRQTKQGRDMNGCELLGPAAEIVALTDKKQERPKSGTMSEPK
jgi:hypothetical protein